MNPAASQHNPYEEVTTQIEPIYEGKVIRLQLEHVTLPDGSSAVREVVKHPGAVAVAALKNNKLLVVEQYRKALGKNQVEIPAGKLEPGEEPLLAAMRELEEETGYTTEQLHYVNSFYTSPGFANEMLHLYFTDQVKEGKMQLDEDEFLECREITYEEALKLMEEGHISDAKTITAIYAWRLLQVTGKFGL